MDVIVKVSVPNYIYRFYQQASMHIAGSTTEDVMADALSAYAGLLSDEISKRRQQNLPNCQQENKDQLV